MGIMITAATGTSSGLFSVEASAVSVSSQASPDELQIELSENGFTPSQAQRTAGTFGIAIENSALTGEYTLKLKAHDGTVVKEVQAKGLSCMDGYACCWRIYFDRGQSSPAAVPHYPSVEISEIGPH